MAFSKLVMARDFRDLSVTGSSGPIWRDGRGAKNLRLGGSPETAVLNGFTLQRR